ncbi:hypothetical protein L1049_018914 [Liquidambar formosana]|uniref:PORR domain-containing protein n=1 Tax=Liquidambar formosana TaxID=63359 RepID=A0AAP0RBL1_LIQFO
MPTHTVRIAVLMNKSHGTKQIHSLSVEEFACISPRRNRGRESFLSWWQPNRSMTTSKRVQDRSKNKGVHDLEIATEKWKIASKVLFLMEVLKKEPEQIIPLRSLDQYRRQINLPEPHKISNFIQKSPKLFELYKDHRGTLWCGMTKEAEDWCKRRRESLRGMRRKLLSMLQDF